MYRRTSAAGAAQPSTGIAVVGAGYVGLTTAVWLASRGHRVRLVEVDEARLSALRGGRSPIHERGVDTLLESGLASGHLTLHGDLSEAAAVSRISVLCVGTPSMADGRADLRMLETASRDVARVMPPGAIIVIKSTVPPGTAVALQRALRAIAGDARVVSCPEFLKEGTALDDLEAPSRVVVGGSEIEAVAEVAAVMGTPGTRTLLTDNTSAELIKYGSNAFLAMKISFINEIANICDLVGGDITAVADGMGADPRIGRAFLDAGLGFGGSCFPKDTRALEHTAGRNGHSFWLLKAAIEVNDRQRMRFVHRVRDALGGDVAGARVCVLGLAFKPGTDDVRQAPAIDVVNRLQELGATVAVHDPVAMPACADLLPDAVFAADPYEAVMGADVVALVTEWPEYLTLDWERVGELVAVRRIVDGRNRLDPARLESLGFEYFSMGRRTTSASRRPAAVANVA